MFGSFFKPIIYISIIILIVCKFAEADQKCRKLVGHSWSTFDQDLGKCLIAIGYKCGFLPQDVASCGHNAHCSSRQYCQCDAPLVGGGGDTHCYPAKSIGERCNYSGNCTRDADLRCIKEENSPDYFTEGICSCLENSFWNASTSYCLQKDCEERTYGAFLDSASKQCLVKIGELVLQPLSYSDHPLSVAEYMDRNMVACPQHSALILKAGDWPGGACHCDEGYVSNEDQTGCFPKRTYGEVCGDEAGSGLCDPASIGLTCEDGICGCGVGGSWKRDKSVCYSLKYCGRHYARLPFNYDVSTQTCVGYIGYGYYLRLVNGQLICPIHSIARADPNRPMYASCECLENFVVDQGLEKCIHA